VTLTGGTRLLAPHPATHHDGFLGEVVSLYLLSEPFMVCRAIRLSVAGLVGCFDSSQT